MNACLICPVPSLEQYVDERASHHLLLAHLLDIPGYIEFYQERARRGDYIILDNGAKEMGAGLSMEHVLEGARRIGAKEVVLTDVRYKGAQTIRAAEDGLQWMMSLKGRIAYDNAGCPKLMVVPQGSNPVQWFDCLRRLMELVEDFRAVVEEMPEPCVAYAYHYDHLFRGGLIRLLMYGRPAIDAHLLGWPRRLDTLPAIAESVDYIRSVDSGKPFSYAKAGVGCVPGVQNPGRDDNFFTEPIPDDRDTLTRLNIETFRGYARDVHAVDLPSM